MKRLIFAKDYTEEEETHIEEVLDFVKKNQSSIETALINEFSFDEFCKLVTENMDMQSIKNDINNVNKEASEKIKTLLEEANENWKSYISSTVATLFEDTMGEAYSNITHNIKDVEKFLLMHNLLQKE